jgi:hypothetical protein
VSDSELTPFEFSPACRRLFYKLSGESNAKKKNNPPDLSPESRQNKNTPSSIWCVLLDFTHSCVYLSANAILKVAFLRQMKATFILTSKNSSVKLFIFLQH